MWERGTKRAIKFKRNEKDEVGERANKERGMENARGSNRSSVKKKKQKIKNEIKFPFTFPSRRVTRHAASANDFTHGVQLFLISNAKGGEGTGRRGRRGRPVPRAVSGTVDSLCPVFLPFSLFFHPPPLRRAPKRARSRDSLLRSRVTSLRSFLLKALIDSAAFVRRAG